MAEGLSKSYGSLEIFTDVDLAIDKGSRVVILGLNGAGKTTLLKLLGGVEKPDTGNIIEGHGLKLGYYAQEHETLDPERTVLENMRSANPDLDLVEVRKTLGSFLFSGDDVDKPAGVLSGGEKTRLALATLVVSSANVLLLDEPTNNLDPASPRRSSARCRPTRARSSSSPTTRAPCTRSSPSGSSCCPTASRICGAPTTRTSSPWRDPTGSTA
jgi:ATPase subunit of ABC transporter with duplicated ATPase domains